MRKIDASFQNDELYLRIGGSSSKVSIGEAEEIITQLLSHMHHFPQSVKMLWEIRTRTYGELVEYYEAKGDEIVTSGYRLKIRSGDHTIINGPKLNNVAEAIAAAEEQYGHEVDVRNFDAPYKDNVSYADAERSALLCAARKLAEAKGISLKQLLRGGV